MTTTRPRPTRTRPGPAPLSAPHWPWSWRRASGVKRPVAEALGWVGRDVAVSDILAATEAGDLRFMMTSASQSNSGASAYFGFLSAFSEHPLIPRNADGERLRDALQDEDIQRLAWERHGFRAATVSGEEDPGDLAIDFAGIPRTIDSVIQMPNPEVMATLTERIAG